MAKNSQAWIDFRKTTENQGIVCEASHSQQYSLNNLRLSVISSLGILSSWSPKPFSWCDEILDKFSLENLQPYLQPYISPSNKWPIASGHRKICQAISQRCSLVMFAQNGVASDSKDCAGEFWNDSCLEEGRSILNHLLQVMEACLAPCWVLRAIWG